MVETIFHKGGGRLNKLTNRPWLKFYSEKNNNLLEIPNRSLYQILERTFHRFPDATAIIYEGRKMAYRQLKEKVDRLANAWKRLGMKKGDRIGLMLANHPDYIISYYAAQMLGAIVVQVNPLYTPRELQYIVNDVGMKYIVTHDSNRRTLHQIETEHLKAVFLSNDSNPDAVALTWPSYDLHELIDRSEPLEAYTEIDVHEDIAVIQYTGGTTGKMKGAMLTHYNLLANVIQSYAMYSDLLEDGKEVTLAATPFYHVFAMTAAMNVSIFSGQAILIVRKFQVDEVLELIKTYRPSFFPGVPTMYNAFVNHPNVKAYGLDCLKVCSSGSAPLPQEILRRFKEITGVPILEGYGLSESSPSTHRNPIHFKRKVGSIGIPIPLTDSKVVDDAGNEVEIGEIGELIVKGPQVMKGYWNQPEETAKALRDGWLYTGDLAKMDEEGYFYIVGRKKEMIISGGFNIYPQEVEDVLYDHPAVKEAAVIGIPDDYSGERVKAFVVFKEGKKASEEELIDHCYQHLTRYKVPKEIEIRDALPRNTVGKLLKRILVEEELKKRKGS